MKNLKLKFLLGVLVLLAGGVNTSWACSCSPPPPCEAFNRAKAVFIGRALRGEKKHERENKEQVRISYSGEIVFEVLEPFSGVSTRLFTVWANNDGMCDSVSFRLGQFYVVYADEAASGKLWASGCGSSHELEPPTYSESDTPSWRKYLEVQRKVYSEELAYLRDIASGKLKGGRLYGAVRAETFVLSKTERLNFKGIANVALKIVNGSEAIEVRTDYEGQFEATSLKPGKYTVTTLPPEGYLLDEYGQQQSQREFELRDCGCGSLWVKLFPDTKLRGRVLDTTGKAVGGVVVNLLASDWQNDEIKDGTIESFSTGATSTDGKGQFSFDRVAPGDYLLGVNVERPTPTSPYPRTFYPNVADIKQAKIVTVEHSQKVGPFEIQVPAQLATQTLQGVVLWHDETPVLGASVRLQIPGGYESQYETLTDAQGRFTLKGLQDRAYAIRVYWHIDPSTPNKTKPSPLGWQSATSEAMDVIFTADAKPIQIYLTRKVE